MKTFSKNQLNVVKAASKDATRPQLAGVLIEGNKTIATNGHILIMSESREAKEAWQPNGVNWKYEESIVPPDNEESFVIPAESVKQALKSFPKTSKYDTTNKSKLAIGLSTMPSMPDSVTVQNSESLTFVASPTDGKFPNYKQVIPDTTEYKKVGFNATLLKTICEVMEKTGNKGNIVLNFHPEDPQNNSVVIENIDYETAEERYKAVIMPVRL